MAQVLERKAMSKILPVSQQGSPGASKIKQIKKINKLLNKSATVASDSQTNIENSVAKSSPKKTVTTVKKVTTIVPNCQNFVIEKIRGLLQQRLGENWSDQIHEKLVTETENQIYNHVISKLERVDIEKSWDNQSFRALYLSKARSIINNLKNDSYVNNKNSEGLLTKYLAGQVSPEQLVNMTPQELAPERWKEHVEQRDHEAKIFSKNNIIGTTDLFKCGKCNERKCTYYELQTRSQDEPMTTFITCLNCGNKWRK